MTDDEIRKLIGEERWRVIEGIIERERKVAEILERRDPFMKAVKRAQRRGEPLSKLLKD